MEFSTGLLTEFVDSALTEGGLMEPPPKCRIHSGSQSLKNVGASFQIGISVGK